MSGTCRSIIRSSILVLCLPFIFTGCNRATPKNEKTVPSNNQANQHDAEKSNSVRRLVASEELLLKLTSRLGDLNESVVNLKLPDNKASSLFSNRVKVGTTETESPVNSLRLFEDVFDSMAFFERAKFALKRGTFSSEDFSQFDSDMIFSGLGKTKQGQWRMYSGAIHCRWESDEPENADSWRISSWRLDRMEHRDSERLMFREVLDHALPTATLKRARESRHWQLAKRHFYAELRAKGTDGDNRFFEIATANHPGISVVDIDRDGFDDLYVTVRWGKNLLFRNRGNGTFDEIAADVGLDIEGRCNAAAFADFDNDGDTDVMIARSFDRSLFLVNEDGRFVDRTEERVAGPMPFEATSVSAADYNGDGLLDVYFSTYHQDDIQQRIDADLSHPDHRIHQYLTADQSSELKRRHREENRSFINQVGPPNILLRNVGNGRFEISDKQGNVAVWRNSFQATWSDFDGDGDQDLYVANDFAPDHFLRNDGEDGFKNAGDSLHMHSLGFGMGASFGDYDNDGLKDLYVSNMYSKAGLRITHQIDRLNPRIRQLAEGNYLYRNRGERMELVSGLSAPSMLVSRAGWSWGGQFVDVNNDSFLDLYVPNGYYTAPEDYTSQVDL